MQSRAAWQLENGRLGVPLAEGYAARVIDFLQRYRAAVHMVDPLPIMGPEGGLKIEVKNTTRETFVTVWSGDYHVFGTTLSDRNPVAQVQARYAKSLHMFQIVPAHEGVSFDGVFQICDNDDNPISMTALPIATFNRRLSWEKRLRVALNDIDDYEDFD